MKKTERQAGRTETLTQRQMNKKRKTNISVYKQREEDGYTNVKSEGATQEKKRLIEERRRRVTETRCIPSIMLCLSGLGWIHMRVEHRSIRFKSEDGAHMGICRF